MSNELGTDIPVGVDERGAVVVAGGVEEDSRWHPVSLKHLEQAPTAHPVPVFAPGPVIRVGVRDAG
jgi:hypothetical protein